MYSTLDVDLPPGPGIRRFEIGPSSPHLLIQLTDPNPRRLPLDHPRNPPAAPALLPADRRQIRPRHLADDADRAAPPPAPRPALLAEAPAAAHDRAPAAA